MQRANFQQQVFEIKSRQAFNVLALELFRHQAQHNAIYRKFVQHLNIKPEGVENVADIPFLPIEAFKLHRVITGSFEPALVFTSSGTTGKTASQHFLWESDWYHKCSREAFERIYGDLREYCILALLPAYLERSGSSLVHMAQAFMDQSGHPQNGFYLNQLDHLSDVLALCEARRQKTLLLGVSFALLDLAERYPQKLRHTTIMETGGMKGRRKELTRPALHDKLKSAFGLETIHSEYGMTELLSQAYATQNGLFECPPWMRVMVREQSDPMQFVTDRTGGINVIDLANIDSCAFIATGDLGRLHENQRFEVLGRFDFSDVRGCNLMVV